VNTFASRNALIDERVAWSLLLAIASRRTGSVSVPLESGGDASLHVDVSGRWQASHGVTEEARVLLDLYAPIAGATEITIGQLGQSLDGRIATESGASHYVTGPQDIERLHRVRALVDAVVVGTNTAASDDPRLTVRRVPGGSPVRVVLDPDGRLDPGLRLFTDGAAPTLTVRRANERRQDNDSAATHGGGAADEGREAVRGVVELSVPVDERGIDLRELLRMLHDRGLKRVLVEGGGVTVSRFIESGLLDRLHVTVAPILIGSGRPALKLSPIASLDQALRPRFRRFPMGQDVLYDLDLRRSRS